MLAGPGLSHPKLGVLAATPMDDEDDLLRVHIVSGDNVGDESPDQLLAGSHRHAWSVPSGIQVERNPREIRYGGSGVWLIEYLTQNHIPFFAFRGAVKGKATGAHIHIGPMSTRLTSGG